MEYIRALKIEGVLWNRFDGNKLMQVMMKRFTRYTVFNPETGNFECMVIYNVPECLNMLNRLARLCKPYTFRFYNCGH